MNRLAMAACVLAGLCATAQAGETASATMEVSFVVRAACSVQAQSAASPQVACTEGTGYRLLRQPAEAVDAAPGVRTAQTAEVWQVMF